MNSKKPSDHLTVAKNSAWYSKVTGNDRANDDPFVSRNTYAYISPMCYFSFNI